MKSFKQALLILMSSPLLWIGGVGAIGSFLTYLLLWSGHLMWLARFADALYAGVFVADFFVLIFLGGFGLSVCGVILGGVRVVKFLRGDAQFEGGEDVRASSF